MDDSSPRRASTAAGGGGTHAAMDRLGEEMVAAGLGGPALIVAGADAIARFACAWASSLERVGIRHRVRLIGGGSIPDAMNTVVDEARSLGAGTIVAAGEGLSFEAAQSAANALHLPFVACVPYGSTIDPAD